MIIVCGGTVYPDPGLGEEWPSDQQPAEAARHEAVQWLPQATRDTRDSLQCRGKISQNCSVGKIIHSLQCRGEISHNYSAGNIIHSLQCRGEIIHNYSAGKIIDSLQCTEEVRLSTITVQAK